MGCTVELDSALREATKGEETRVWSFEEGHCGHLLQVQRSQ